jgi:hypothetical protein
MRLRRQAVALVLAFALAAPWAVSAAPRLERRDRAEPPVVSIPEIVSHAWSLFTSLWGVVPACDEGSSADPLGCPVRPTTDEGAYIDPLG